MQYPDITPKSKLLTADNLRKNNESFHEKNKKCTLLVKVIFTFIVFAEVMMEIMIDDTIWSSDNYIIHGVQKLVNFKESKIVKKIAIGIEFWTHPLFISSALLALYNAYDPLTSVKACYIYYYTLLVQCITVVVLFQEPRPFWVDSKIYSPICTNSFSGPSDKMIDSVFIFIYIIRLEYMQKHISKSLMIGLVAIFAINAAVLFFFLMVIGNNFFYQLLGGALVGSLIILIAITFDKYITSQVVKLGFIEKKARKRIVLLFVKLCIAYLIIYGIVAVLPNNYDLPMYWIENFNVTVLIRNIAQMAS
jgi:hypothetical protein